MFLDRNLLPCLIRGRRDSRWSALIALWSLVLLAFAAPALAAQSPHDPGSRLSSSIDLPTASWELFRDFRWRRFPTLTYDPVRERLIMFGGQFDIYTTAAYSNEVWTFDLTTVPGTWQPLSVSGAPPHERSKHSAVYDPVRDRLLIFAGEFKENNHTSYYSDVWALSLSGTPAWTEVTPAGSTPSGRPNYTMVYDSARDRVVAYAGPTPGDVWFLSLSGTIAWSHVVVSSGAPVARSRQAGIYDPVRDRLIIHGGRGISSDLGDTYAFSFATNTWSQLATSGLQPLRFNHSAFFDPVGDQMVFFGGELTSSGAQYDVFALPLSGDSQTWGSLYPGGVRPVASSGAVATYDSGRQHLVTFGGTAEYPEVVHALTPIIYHNWAELTEDIPTPNTRKGHTMIFDPVRGRVILFGGVAVGSDTDPYGPYKNDVWTLTPSEAPRWQRVYPINAWPPRRAYHTAIYDPVRDRMIVYGGRTEDQWGYYVFLDDVWELSLSEPMTWTHLHPSGVSPGVNAYHAAAYDSSCDCMLVWSSTNLELSLDPPMTWITVSPGGHDSANKYNHVAIEDPVGSRVIVFGGSPSTGETIQLGLSDPPTWSTLLPGPDPPALVEAPAAAYVPEMRSIVSFPGNTSATPSVGFLSLRTNPEWNEVVPTGPQPPALQSHAVAYDPAGRHLYMFGGPSGSYLDFYPVLWVLNLDFPQTGVEPTPTPAGLHIDWARWHDGVRGVEVSFTLASAAPSRLDVLDVSGRRVATRTLDGLSSGAHRVNVAAGELLPAGVFFVHLKQGSQSATAKTVVLH